MNKNTPSKQPYCSHFGGLFNISIIKLIRTNERFSNRRTTLQTSTEMQRYCSNNVVSPPFEHGDNFHEVCKFASEPIGIYGIMEIHLSVILPLELFDRAKMPLDDGVSFHDLRLIQGPSLCQGLGQPDIETQSFTRACG